MKKNLFKKVLKIGQIKIATNAVTSKHTLKYTISINTLKYTVNTLTKLKNYVYPSFPGTFTQRKAKMGQKKMI